jgi:hypothetical protein
MTIDRVLEIANIKVSSLVTFGLSNILANLYVFNISIDFCYEMLNDKYLSTWHCCLTRANLSYLLLYIKLSNSQCYATYYPRGMI